VKYEVEAIAFIDSIGKPPAGRIGVAVLSALALVATLRLGLPLSQTGGALWTILGIAVFSCALIWSTLLAVMASSATPQRGLGYAATTAFVLGALAALVGALLIALAVLLLYVGFKVIRFFMENDEQREARAAHEAEERALKAEREQEAALARQQREEDMVRPFGPGMYCRNCGHVVSKQARLCPECGGNPQEEARLFAHNTMGCRNCGHEVSKEATRCPECGGNPQEEARLFARNTTECRNCGHEVSKEATHCPECGGNPKERARDFSSPTKACHACGHDVNKDALRCPKCDAPVETGIFD
jgi:RNA polymerase subunit RPABC4/transcription elongation factor Spt4